jgi:uridylate kinase
MPSTYRRVLLKISGEALQGITTKGNTKFWIVRS